MSHLTERPEKNCLNCQANIIGRYCHICGQENILPKESFWHLVSHFFQDITHFDGKFFSSLKFLVTRPGFLSGEYIRGRRASYLNPVRMYVFTSAFFFLLFFSVGIGEKEKALQGPSKSEMPIAGQHVLTDSLAIYPLSDSIRRIKENDLTSLNEQVKQDSSRQKMNKGMFTGIYLSEQAYDSALNSGEIRHSWLTRIFYRRLIHINREFGTNSKGFITGFTEKLLHSLPQMLFISLPVLALLLKLLYWRRKEFYYVSHVIFSIHLYILVFIGMACMILLSLLHDYAGWSLFGMLQKFVLFYLFYYQYRSMRTFYKQGRMKTIAKQLLLDSLFFIVLCILFIIFVMISLFKI